MFSLSLSLFLSLTHVPEFHEWSKPPPPSFGHAGGDLLSWLHLQIHCQSTLQSTSCQDEKKGRNILCTCKIPTVYHSFHNRQLRTSVLWCLWIAALTSQAPPSTQWTPLQTVSSLFSLTAPQIATTYVWTWDPSQPVLMTVRAMETERAEV